MKRLKREQVLLINEYLKMGHTQKAIAEAFRVNVTTINHISTGFHWSELTGRKRDAKFRDNAISKNDRPGREEN